MNRPFAVLASILVSTTYWACSNPCEKLAEILCAHVDVDSCLKAHAMAESTDSDVQRRCKARLSGDSEPPKLSSADMPDMAKYQLETISKFVEIYKIKFRQLPNALHDLVDEEYLRKDALLDPWKTQFVYEPKSNGAFRLCSPGEDKQPGNEDDICRDQTL